MQYVSGTIYKPFDDKRTLLEQADAALKSIRNYSFEPFPDEEIDYLANNGIKYETSREAQERWINEFEKIINAMSNKRMFDDIRKILKLDSFLVLLNRGIPNLATHEEVYIELNKIIFQTLESKQYLTPNKLD